MGQTSKKQRWTPSESTFRRFLLWLDDGQDSGGERYLEMRKRLVRYFDQKQCVEADDLADETLNRVARRLEEEGSISEASPAQYCYIVAKFVFLEHLRLVRPDPSAEESDLDSATISLGAHPPDPVAEARLDCLEQCLQKLVSGERDLILEYYRGKQAEKIQLRRELAERLTLSANALTIRACRIRNRLEDCVLKCAQRS
jgi:DNA-directed RNA polymerase specialized sigma24 family protein